MPEGTNSERGGLPTTPGTPQSKPGALPARPGALPARPGSLPAKPGSGGGLPAPLPKAPTPSSPGGLPTPQPSAAPQPAPRREPVRRTQPEPAQPEYEDYYEEPTPAVSRQRRAPSRTVSESEPQYTRKNPPKGNKKEVRAMSRGQFLALRWLLVGSVLLLAAFGVKSIVLPPSLPSQNAIVAQVQQGMGMTNFPANQAEGFVLGFTRTYLTVNKGNLGQRSKDLEPYSGGDRLQGGITFPEGTDQRVIDGPYIFGVRYTSDHTAVFTTGSRVSSGKWVYLAINVFYDPTTRAFSIAHAPILVPAPATTTPPSEDTKRKPDEEATKSAENTINTFFGSWAASNQSELSVVLAPKADARVQNGLGGTVRFVKMSNFVVYQPESSDDPGWRVATAQVTWEEGSKDNPIRYDSTYMIQIVRSADRWLIRDILPHQFVPRQKGSSDAEGEG